MTDPLILPPQVTSFVVGPTPAPEVDLAPWTAPVVGATQISPDVAQVVDTLAPDRDSVAPRPEILARPESVWIWGLPLARLTVRQTVDEVDRLIAHGQPAMFITANLHYAMLSERDPRLRSLNERAAFLVADGMPMVWYSRLGKRPLPERVTGADLIYLLCERAAQRGHRVFLLGGAPGVAERAAAELVRRYPGLIIAGTASPAMDQLSPQEHFRLLSRIRRSRPDLLMVAFGQPKGELWLAENLAVIGAPASVQVGASFDFVVGRIRRAPRWSRRVGMEWLYRLLKEPRRLAPRYFSNALFLLRAVFRDAFGRTSPGD